MYCLKCGRKNPENARYCQDCGQPLGFPLGPNKAEGQRRSSGLQNIALGLGIGLAILTGVCALIIRSGDGPGTRQLEPRDIPLGASAACSEFVSRKLISPATEKFAPYDPKEVSVVGPNRFRVTSYVDSQNLFGAVIRQNFTCEVEFKGGDQWVLLHLDMKSR